MTYYVNGEFTDNPAYDKPVAVAALAAGRLVYAVINKRRGVWELFSRLKEYAAAGQPAAQAIIEGVRNIARKLAHKRS